MLSICISFQEWYEESTNTIITYIMVLTSMMFNIFIFCFIGELVTDQVKLILINSSIIKLFFTSNSRLIQLLRQCKKVGEAAYMTNWYYLSHKTVLGLILIILRSRTVIKITAGKVFHMSISTFGVVSIIYDF